jgi:hypothetical protein
MLTSLRAWLDKAQAHATAKGFNSKVLVSARLAPDMLPFSAQVIVACDHAKGAAARLAGVDVPKYEDNEATLAELQARIDKSLAFIDTVREEQFEGAASREIVIPSRAGERRFVGHAYLVKYATPNFCFHVTTAYAILRHNGVDVGKADYLGAR